ncbi:MAG: BACON domain-containing protein [Bryobacteraceae bacterium]
MHQGTYVRLEPGESFSPLSADWRRHGKIAGQSGDWSGWRWAIALAALFLLTQAVSLGQLAPRGKAFAHVTDPTGDSTPAVQYNSAGGTITVTRTAIGTYSVYVPNLVNTEGISLAFADGATADGGYCNGGVWGPAPFALRAVVTCFNSAGAPADIAFRYLFQFDARTSAAWSSGYLWNNQESNSSPEGYTPTPYYSWHSRGGDINVRRWSPGAYRARFAGLGPAPNGGTALLTGYGNNARCRIQDWTAGVDVDIEVRCFTASGNPVDTRFMLTFLTDTALGAEGAEQAGHGAFLRWDGNAQGGLPALSHQYNSAGAASGVVRNSAGSYTVWFPGQIAGSSATAFASAIGGGDTYCNTGAVSASTGKATVRVECRNGATPADSDFTVLFLSGSKLLAATPVPPGTAPATGWAHVDPAGTVPAGLRFNSSTGGNAAVRLETGLYRVTMPGIGMLPGAVHVSAVSGSHYCKTVAWGPPASAASPAYTQEIYVSCFAPTGVPADGAFDVLFYNESRTGQGGFALADIALASDAYTVAHARKWNSSGGAVRVVHSATGSYRVEFDGVGGLPGNLGSGLATAFGNGPERCKAISWAGPAPMKVEVRCFAPNGSPADSAFVASYFTDVAFGMPAAGANGAYVLADQPQSVSYVPVAQKAVNTSGGPVAVSRSGSGIYSVRIDGVKATSSTTVQVRSTGPGGGYCSALPWQAAPGTGVTAGVRCHDAAGQPADSTFALTYVADGPCLFTFASSSLSASAGGGALANLVTTGAGCSWSAVSSSQWIAVTSPTRTGSGEATIQVSANASGSPRSGIVTVGSNTFTVSQSAACSYSLDRTSSASSRQGGASTVTVIAPQGCPWTARSNSPWISIASGASGSGGGTVAYTVQPTTMPSSRTGTLTIAGIVFTDTQAGDPNPVPIPGTPSPVSGSGMTQTFAIPFTDSLGDSDLQVMNVLINGVLDGRGACYLAYEPSTASTGTLSLVNDDGKAGGPFAGQLAVPSTGAIANSQCSIDGAGTSVTVSGASLVLRVKITFAPSFAGDHVVYVAASDQSGHNSGWMPKGVWSVPAVSPLPVTATDLSPGRSSASSVTITAEFLDTRSFADDAVVNVLINNAIDGRNACYVAYVPSTGRLLLVNDAGQGAGPFAGALTLPGSGTAANSQCEVDAAQSSAVVSGDTLTLMLRLSFKPSFRGNRVVYLAARHGSDNSGWQAMGTILVQ